MNSNDDKDLWDLLGKASQRKAGPLFTRNLMHAIEQEENAQEDRKPGFRSFADLFSSGKKWIATSAAACAALLCGALVLTESPSNDKNKITDIDQVDVQELVALEQTALALSDDISDNSLVEVASCYSDSLNEYELQYVLASL